MHKHDRGPWVHDHVFDAGNRAGERGTRAVMWITLAMMLVESTAGWYYHSMALLADGIHMSSHAVAIGLSAFAYALARRHVADPRYAFGTWKIEVLGGFASAVFLMVIVALMLFGSIERLLAPMPIHYGEAMAVAVVGLIVNIVSALILGTAHDHGAHGHHHEGSHHHDDLNLRSAYVHVVTDAMTSLLAIVALAGGWLYGWNWLDPAMGIAGAILVAIWARGLLADTARVLLDREMDAPVVAEIRSAVSSHSPPGSHELADLHVWRIGKDAYACALSVVTHDPALTPATVREWLAEHEEIVHATIEIHQCPRG